MPNTTKKTRLFCFRQAAIAVGLPANFTSHGTEVLDEERLLEKLDGVIGTTTHPEVAVIFDWENRWAIEDAFGPRREKKDYLETGDLS